MIIGNLYHAFDSAYFSISIFMIAERLIRFTGTFIFLGNDSVFRFRKVVLFLRIKMKIKNDRRHNEEKLQN